MLLPVRGNGVCIGGPERAPPGVRRHGRSGWHRRGGASWFHKQGLPVALTAPVSALGTAERRTSQLSAMSVGRTTGRRGAHQRAGAKPAIVIKEEPWAPLPSSRPSAFG